MHKVLMTHLYYGDPNEEFSLKLAETLLTNGADILEVGIAYTDPVCDGEVFQRACKRALEKGITPLKVLKGIREIREKGYKNPIYLTSYYAPIYKIGLEKFVKSAKAVGVTGFIIPDLLLEEQQSLRRLTDKYGLSLIQFATVYSTKERLKQICKASTDFIYTISLPGVTGDEKEVTPSRSPDEHLEGGLMDSFQVDLRGLIREIKSITHKKLFVGFGIKSPHDSREILSFGADGVIIGSAIARIYEQFIFHKKPVSLALPLVEAFIKSLNAGTIT